MHEPCVMWYLSPFACLYDLLQFGLGQRNGLESSSDDEGRESVVLARGVIAEAGIEVPELDAEAEVEACAERGRYEAAPFEGEGTRDVEGVFAGVVLVLKRSAGGRQP